MNHDVVKARRLDHIRPFHVMEILSEAYRLQAQGQNIIHLEVGEPDFPTPEVITQAGIEALKAHQTRYTQALGIPPLRERIAEYYPSAYRPGIERIAVTPGSSSALQLVFACLLNPGDEVLLADPGYPCNQNFIRCYNGIPKTIPTDASTHYQLNAQSIRQHWTEKTRAVLLGTPANPTGSIIPDEEMRRIAATVRQLGGVLIVDEIYHGLVYEATIQSALHAGDDIFIINSFSKYYGMTGWRLGWMVMPEAYQADIEKLAQNLFISPNTPAQYAALQAFSQEAQAEFEYRRTVLRQRRDFLVSALGDLGFAVPCIPDGAFYVYADSSRLSDQSDELALKLLHEAMVGVAPGKDFGHYRHQAHIRFSYANSMANLQEAMERIAKWLRLSPTN
jgi:aspartate/methionine/tyrosine aminotransferase